MSMKERIESEARAVIPVTNDSLICKDCTHRSGKVLYCAVYMDEKPNSILKNGPCRYYKKEQ